MALKEIANTDRVITITPDGGAWNPGVANYTEELSQKVKANNKNVVIDRITWTMTVPSCTLAGFTHCAGAAADPIDATGNKVCTDHGPGFDGHPIRKGDKGKCSGTFQRNVFPFDFKFCKCDFEVTDAGQVKAKCE